ncbi:thiol reductant ABC exporter subunit CydD [Bartonella sp. DGB2]|uniref:thiol reductant ABC exporter subunit CydD n=1 Tax=Bartonella sp. DGB2 TaxID=3388426 RepID=UPI00398FC4BD
MRFFSEGRAGLRKIIFLSRSMAINKKPLQRNAKKMRLGGFLQLFATLLFIPQAALIAQSVEWITEGINLSTLFIASFSILSLAVSRATLEALGERLTFKAAREQLSYYRLAAIDALAQRSPLDPSRPASGAAASILAEQAELIVPYLARFQPARFKAILVPLIILICIFPISWMGMLILLVSMPLIPLFMALIGWKAQEASEKQLAATGDMNGFLLDRLRGLATLRSLGAVDLTATRLKAHTDTLKARTMAVLKIAFLSSAVLELFAALGVALVAVYVGFSLLGMLHFGAWTQGLNLAKGLFLLLLAPAFFNPLRELAAVWHDRASGYSALKALKDMADKGLAIALITNPNANPNSDNSAPENFDIELKNLYFSYDPQKKPFISGFNYCIREGEHVALVGASGSGKSTLLALIAGLIAEPGGCISLGGKALGATEDWRHHIAWIGQKPHIFSDSFMKNLTLGRTGMQTKAALDLAQLTHLATNYGKRPLDEGGQSLSGGEARLLAFARAACNPNIRIILADEPTAHLDVTSASKVITSLSRFAKDKTLIVATHNPQLIARMQRVIQLKTPSIDGILI